MGIIGRVDPVQSTAIITRNNFTGDGSTVDFVMTKKPPHERHVWITIDGIKQHEDVYSVLDKTITFTSAPANNAKIEAMLMEDVAEVVPPDGSINTSKLADYAASISSEGYYTLPGGLIIQWGLSDTTSGQSTVTFPLEFPTACLAVLATMHVDDNNGRMAQVKSFTTTQAIIRKIIHDNTATSTSARWFAIGH